MTLPSRIINTLLAITLIIGCLPIPALAMQPTSNWKSADTARRNNSESSSSDESDDADVPEKTASNYSYPSQNTSRQDDRDVPSTPILYVSGFQPIYPFYPSYTIHHKSNSCCPFLIFSGALSVVGFIALIAAIIDSQNPKSKHVRPLPEQKSKKKYRTY